MSDIIDGMKQAASTCFQKYADFSGRADRPEFWYWQLLIFLASFVINFIIGFTIGFTGSNGSMLDVIPALFNLAIFLPALAVGARRLHDVNKSGWWQLIVITIVGIIPLAYWWSQPSVIENNRF